MNRTTSRHLAVCGVMVLSSVVASSLTAAPHAVASQQGCDQHSYWYVRALGGGTRYVDAAGTYRNTAPVAHTIAESWQRQDVKSGSITGDTGLSLEAGIAKVNASVSANITRSVTITRGTTFTITMAPHHSGSYSAGVLKTPYVVSYRTIYSDCHVKTWNSGVVYGVKKFFSVS